MPYCPTCKSEYEKEITKCSDCGATLVETLQDDLENNDMELLCNVITEAEAYLIKGLLKAEGVKVFIKPLEAVLYEGVYGSSDGVWGKLFVFVEDLERAKTILKDYLSATPEEGDSFEQAENDELLEDDD